MRWKVSGGLTFTAPILASLLLVSSLTVPWIEASITGENSLEMPDAYRCLLGCFMPYAETFGPLEHQLAKSRGNKLLDELSINIPMCKIPIRFPISAPLLNS